MEIGGRSCLPRTTERPVRKRGDECFDLPVSAAPQSHGRKSVVRGLPFFYREPEIKLYRPRGLNPVVNQREELPLLPFGNPIGFVPAASRGVTQ